LKTYEFVDFVVPFLSKRDLERDGIKEKLAEATIGLAEGKEKKIEFTKKITDVLKSDIVCNFSVSVVAPHLAATVHGKTSGLKSFLEHFKKIAEKGEGEGSGDDLEEKQHETDSD